MTATRRPHRKQRNERPVLLVVCQDTGGVLTYLRDTLGSRARDDKMAVIVQARALDARTLFSKAERALTRKSRDFPDADFVILVVDQDQDPHLSAAVEKSKGHERIEIVASAPCFEYFFLMHYSDARPAVTTFDGLLPHLRSFSDLKNYHKASDGVPILALSDRLPNALQNSDRVRRACVADGSVGPMTEADLLVEAVRVAKGEGLEGLVRTKSGRDKKRLT